MTDGSIGRGGPTRPVMIGAPSIDSIISSSSNNQFLSELASTLEKENAQNEEFVQYLLRKLVILETKLQRQGETIEAEINEWKEKHTLVEKELQRVGAHPVETTKDPPTQFDDSNDIHDKLRRKNDEILEKIRQLTHENGQLLAKCRQHEDEEPQREELRVFAEELQEENNEIHERMEEMCDRLVNVTKIHEDRIQRYEKQLTRLKDEKNQAELFKEEANTKMSKKLKYQTVKAAKLKLENEEMYETCEALHKKILSLREALKQVRGSDESGSTEDNDARNERDIKLATLQRGRVSWANVNQQRAQERLSSTVCTPQNVDNDDVERDSISIMTDDVSWQNLR